MALGIIESFKYHWYDFASGLITIGWDCPIQINCPLGAFMVLIGNLLMTCEIRATPAFPFDVSLLQKASVTFKIVKL